jgi:hypothetical protein
MCLVCCASYNHAVHCRHFVPRTSIEWSIGALKLLSRRGERVEERVVHGVLTRGWFEPPVLQCEIDLLRRGHHARAGQHG